MASFWWVILPVAMMAVVIELWSIHTRKKWSFIASAVAVVCIALADPFLAVYHLCETRALRRKRDKSAS